VACILVASGAGLVNDLVWWGGALRLSRAAALGAGVLAVAAVVTLAGSTLSRGAALVAPYWLPDRPGVAYGNVSLGVAFLQTAG
jgi:hypothetical protein